MGNENAKIPGGYILFARKTLESEIMNKPPLYFKLWGWMLLQAKFKTLPHLNRGQFLTSIKKMQKAMTFKAGGRTEKPSIDQIRAAYRFLSKSGMVTTSKTTGGMIVTISNYLKYQDFKSYEIHAETHTIPENRSEPHPETIPETHREKPVNGSQSAITEQKSIPKPTPKPTPNPTANPTPYIGKNEEIHQNRSNKNIIYKKILPELETGESDFERDRRVFFHTFPGVKTFQLFDDNPDRKDKTLTKQFHLKDSMPVKYTLRLEELNAQGAGVYMCINETNGKSRKATDVIRVRAVFADFDGAPIDPVWQFEPSMVIESSPGKYHAYWLSSDVPLDGFKQIQECIALKFGSDPKVKDLPRVMRVPGFEHRKSTPFLSKIIHYTGQQFAFDYLTDIFPPPPRKKWSAPKYQAPSDPNTEFKGQYGTSKGGRNCHLSARIGGMLNRGLNWTEIESEAFKEAAACSPPLTESETRAVLKSMRRYA